MPKFMFNDGAQVRVVAIPRWAMWLAGAAILVLGAFLLVLAAGFALILIPLGLVTGAIASWVARRRLREARDLWERAQEEEPALHRRTTADVIEGDYRVIEAEDSKRR